MGAALPPPRSARRSPTRPWWAFALAAVLLAVVLVVTGALYFPVRGNDRSTVLPGRLVGPDPENASFLQDREIADALAANLSGGPFALVGGFAITSVRGATLPLDASGASTCPLIPRPYASIADVVIPPVAGVTGGGLAPVWTYDYLGSDGQGVRVAVEDGKAIALGSIIYVGPGCSGAERPAVNVSTPFDSSSIALLGLDLGGATFLTENPGAEVTYSLAPGLEPGLRGQIAEEWNVTFDACGGVSSAVSTPLGSTLSLYFDADSGTLEATGTTTYDCPQGADAPIPYELPLDLQVNAPVVEILGTMALYNDSIAQACCGLTFGNLTMDLELSGNAPVPSGVSLDILNATGAEICELTGAELSGAVVPCGALVTAGDLLSLRLPADGNGSTTLAIDGRWDFTGSVTVPLGNATEVPPS
jgi:hypothetical protein